MSKIFFALDLALGWAAWKLHRRFKDALVHVIFIIVLFECVLAAIFHLIVITTS